MKHLAVRSNYKEGLAFTFSFSWYIEKIQGNVKKSEKEIRKALELLNEIQNPDQFIYHFIYYSYAVEEWLRYRRNHVVEILERCAGYFFKNKLYQSLTRALGILIIIYQQTQNRDKSMKLVRRILTSYDILAKMPKAILSIIYYFISIGHKLCFALNEAEKYLKKQVTPKDNKLFNMQEFCINVQ
jgi:hypothetical protein